MSLRISDALSLPREAATWVITYVAKRGAGKTYDAAVLLQREETANGSWVYWLADGAKERIKEAS